MKVVGVMGGSYNPVHIGHIILASYIAQWGPVDEVMLMLSPQNPLKGNTDMASDIHRMAMLRLACSQSDTAAITASDIELHLPRPSYTIDTLNHLSRTHPDVQFRLIIGSDNWTIFSQWRASDEIISRYGVIVYPRPGYPLSGEAPIGVTFVDAPQIELSSTFIRRSIAEGMDMNFFLPSGVYDYIKHHQLY